MCLSISIADIIVAALSRVFIVGWETTKFLPFIYKIGKKVHKYVDFCVYRRDKTLSDRHR